jgi:predicted component of type VI protein secretion system
MTMNVATDPKGGMVAMKVQLIVVQGKSEGKTIPLSGPVFKIGRGETCHLRPNSERVSREHAEFSVTADSVTIRDLGSRNGTLVNGKALNRPVTLKDRDLVQVGPLTFTVSILDAPVVGASVPSAPAERSSSAEPAPGAPEPWLDAPGAGSGSGMRGSETILIPAFFEPPTARAGAPAEEASDDEYERHPVVDGETVLDLPTSNVAGGAAGKKPRAEGGDKQSNDAAAEILRKMMERRPVSK